MCRNRRFTFVEVGYGEEETKNFGQRTEFSSPTSLYEVHTAATIAEEDDENILPSGDNTTLLKDLEPSISCTSAVGIVAVAVDSYLHVFNIQYGTKLLFTLHIPEIQRIFAICFLPDTDIMSVVCDDGKLYFVSLAYRNSVLSMELTSPECLTRSTLIAAKDFFGDYIVNVCCGKRCYSVRLVDFEACLMAYREPKKAYKIIEKIQKTPVLCTELNRVPSDIASLPITSANILTTFNGDILISDNMDGNKSTCYSNDKRFAKVVRSRQCGDSGIFLFLTSDGYLFVLDTWTCVFLSEKQILPDEVCGLDFVIINSGLQELSSSTKLAFLVKIDAETQFQIRSFGNSEMLYSLVVSSNSLLVNYVSDEDGAVFLVEYIESSESCSDSIRLRSVFECQPELRLERLLNRCQFDEAERFALLFKLDLQRVYKARASYLLSCLDSDVVEQKTFDSFIGCLDKITDHNWVGESCSAGVTLCRSLDWIIALLQYSESRKVTDFETLDSLYRLRYNLGTYRMLFGPEKASFDRDSAWNDFVSDNLWKELFLSFCQQGCATEARLLWGRYNSVLKPWMQKDFHAFLSFLDALSDYLTEHMSAGELLDVAEHELLPVVLYAHSQELSEHFFDWLLSFGRRLEALRPDEFPENALYVCSVMERTTRAMINDAVTPLQQAELVHALAVIRIDTDSEDYPMGRLNVYVRDLKEMDKLKKKYDCRISYDFYKDQTTESICHLILKRSKTVHHVRANITQFAIPYMEEYKLDIDQTLYNYILEMAQLSAGVVTNVNPWDALCLAVAETIRCHGLRCKAVIGIAKRAYPPWTKQLCGAVEAMLNDTTIDAALRSELQRQCDFAQLGQVLMPYAVPFEYVEKLTSTSRYVESLICFVLRQKVEVDLEKRVVDCIKVTMLVDKLNIGVVNKEQCYIWCCKHIISEFGETDMFSTLVRFINTLGESDRLAVVQRLISDTVCRTNCNFSSLTQVEKDTRLLHIDAALYMLERYCFKASFQESWYNVVLTQLKGVKKLQERFDLFVGCDVLVAGKEQMFEKFIATGGNLHNTSLVLEFASHLTFSLGKACAIAANSALAAKEVVLAIHYATFGLESVTQACKQLLDVCARCSISALWSLHDLAKRGELDQLFILVESLTAFASRFVEAAVSKMLHHHQALLLSTYMSLFIKVIEQCQIGESEEQNAAQQVGNMEKIERSEIYGMNRRLGVYRLQSDGAIFDKAEAVRSMALVSLSIIEPTPENAGKLDKLHEEMRNDWESLFMFLFVNNQPFLEVCVRSFSSSLPYVCQQKLLQHSSIGNSLRSLCERVLLQYPSDLCLISAALFVGSPAFAKKVLLELRNWTKSRKTPQLMLNVIRVSRFVSILFGDYSAIEQMAQSYISYAWTRRMTKLGASMPVDGSTEAVVLEFVKARVAVNELVDFCIDFGLDKYEAVLQYALKMSRLCSMEKDDGIADKMFRLASNAFNLLTLTEDIFLRLYGTLTLLCPYNYRVIELLITEIKKRANGEGDQVMLTSRLITLYSFLTTIERANSITECEIRWYQERQKCIEQKGSDNGLFSIDHDFLGLSTSSTYISAGVVNMASEVYEKPVILQSSLPVESRFRLPFHVFLFEDEKDIKNILLPIINAELTLFNVNSWQQLARSLKHLCISKSSLLSGAVMLVVRGHIRNGTTINEDEVQLIETLLANASNQMVIVDGLLQGFKSIPLCETKLRLLEIGIHVCEKWLQLPETQISKDARDDVGYWLEKLTRGLKLLKTEYLLQKANLLNEDTADIVAEPEQLIVHIYSKEVDWDDCRGRDERLELIYKIAKIHDLDLVSIQTNLLEEWLPECNRKAANCDLNETDDTRMVIGHEEGEMGLRIPYLDESLTKVLHLLYLRDRRQSALSLAAELNKDWSHSSYGTKVRSICCLLKLCTPVELENFIQMDVSSLCSSIERLLYGRLIELSMIELPLKTFLDKNKQSLVRSLLSNNYRQTSQLAYLASCMVVDYDLVDRSVIDVLLTRIHGSGSRTLLIKMLSFCAAHRELADVRNLVQLWARSADWIASDIDVNSLDAREMVHKLLYFCLSCPLEGGRAFGSLCSTVDALRLPLASQLIRIAASVTVRCGNPVKTGRENEVLDLYLKWKE